MLAKHGPHNRPLLERVNRTLARLEEWECTQLIPTEIRPDVRKPILKREALESLRGMLEGVLREQE